VKGLWPTLEPIPRIALHPGIELVGCVVHACSDPVGRPRFGPQRSELLERRLNALRREQGIRAIR